jgi:hypothetical protein
MDSFGGLLTKGLGGNMSNVILGRFKLFMFEVEVTTTTTTTFAPPIIGGGGGRPHPGIDFRPHPGIDFRPHVPENITIRVKLRDHVVTKTYAIPKPARGITAKVLSISKRLRLNTPTVTIKKG